MRKGLAVVAAIVVALCLAGCAGGEGVNAGSSGDGVSILGAAPGKADSIKVEEIDWSVEEGLVNGTRCVAFSYTNNTSFTVMEVEVRFDLREGLTDEELSVFDPVFENPYWSTPAEKMYIIGASRVMAEPGEAPSAAACSLCGTFTYVTDPAQYELMEPSVMTVTYLGGDGRLYVEHYDYLTGKYSLSSNSGMQAVSWSTSELSSHLPALSAPVLVVTWDDENLFSFNAAGVDRTTYEAYLQACKDAGFVGDEISSASFFNAADAEGRDLLMNYSASNETLGVSLSSNE